MSRVNIGAGLSLKVMRDGYVMTNGKSTVRVKGAAMEDTSFSQVGLGTINITRLKKAMAEGKVPYETKDLIMSRQAIETFLVSRDIDIQRLKDILADDKLYHEPIISLYDEKTDESYIVDGNHRIAAHLVRHSIVVTGNVVPLSEIEPFRVHMWLNGEYYVDNESDIRSTFGMHTDPSGNIRKP